MQGHEDFRSRVEIVTTIPLQKNSNLRRGHYGTKYPRASAKRVLCAL